MTKWKKILCAVTAVLFAACTSGSPASSGEDPGDGPIDGGTKDNSDPNAPKEIKSEDLIYFRADFGVFVNENHDYRWYAFEAKKSEGKWILCYQTYPEETVEITEKEAALIQKEIAENHYAEMNGYHRITAGLPGELAAWYIDALYSSGESISFSLNGEPDADWGKSLRECMLSILKNHDIIPEGEE